MEGRFGRCMGRSGTAKVQKTIRRGEEERKCMRGCSERESEISRGRGRNEEER